MCCSVLTGCCGSGFKGDCICEACCSTDRGTVEKNPGCDGSDDDSHSYAFVAGGYMFQVACCGRVVVATSSFLSPSRFVIRRWRRAHSVVGGNSIMNEDDAYGHDDVSGNVDNGTDAVLLTG